MDTDNRVIHGYISALLDAGINVPTNVQRAAFRLDLGGPSPSKQFLFLEHYDIHQKKMWEKETEALGLPVVKHHDEEQADHKALGQTGRKATWAADSEGHTTGN